MNEAGLGPGPGPPWFLGEGFQLCVGEQEKPAELQEDGGGVGGGVDSGL